MTPPPRIPFLKQGLALGAKRHRGFVHAWNWLIHSFWHMTLGCGLHWGDKWHGAPKIELAIEAGDGIDVEYKKGKVRISAGDGYTYDTDDESGGGGYWPDDVPRAPEDGDSDGGDGSGGGKKRAHKTGGSGGGGRIPGPFEPVYTDGVLSGLANCIFCAERAFIDMGGITLSGITSSSNGCIILTITHPTSANTDITSSSAAVSFVGAIGDMTNGNVAQTVIPLYHITSGVVDLDLRAVPTAVLAR